MGMNLPASNSNPFLTGNARGPVQGNSIQRAPLPPLSLAVIQQRLGPDVLNASRIRIDQLRLSGKKENNSVPLLGQRSSWQTGVAWIDPLLESGIGMLDYVPQATQDACTSALKSGLTGGLLGTTATAGLMGLLTALKIDEKASGKLKVAVVLGYGAVAGALSGIGGFIWSLGQNLRDVHRHLVKNPADYQIKTG